MDSSSIGKVVYDGSELAVLSSLFDKTSKYGHAKLKIFIRNLNLPPSHPIRKSLWSQLLSTKYSINLQVSAPVFSCKVHLQIFVCLLNSLFTLLYNRSFLKAIINHKGGHSFTFFS